MRQIETQLKLFAMRGKCVGRSEFIELGAARGHRPSLVGRTWNVLCATDLGSTERIFSLWNDGDGYVIWAGKGHEGKMMFRRSWLRKLGSAEFGDLFFQPRHYGPRAHQIVQDIAEEL